MTAPTTLHPAVARSESSRIEPYLHIDRVGKDFRLGRETVNAIRDVSLDVRQGEFVAFIGHSGCGKSTVLNMVAGIAAPSRGTIRVGGHAVTAPGPDRAMVFQSYSLLPWLTVEDNVCQAVEAVFQGSMTSKDKRERTERFLRIVNLWEHRRKRPSEISGGMRQRTAIARAFAVKPDMLLLDEPFGALDALTKGSLQDELLAMWRSDGRRQTILMVTHDIDEAIFLADRLLIMSNIPTQVRAVIEVDLPRPRQILDIFESDRANDIKKQALSILHAEAMRSFSRGSKAAADFVDAYLKRSSGA
jgi:nitrate/nitrite transport system ATP-binding protein